MTATLTYHVAVTLDGRIAHLDGTYDGFLDSGEHVDAFVDAIRSYSAVLMGRRTYEVGLKAGLAVGQPPYPGRPNHVFSSTLEAPPEASPDFHLQRGRPEVVVQDLKARLSGEIWLCGGGELAGTLIEAGLVNDLVLKVNPILLGDGRPLAAGLTCRQSFRLVDCRTYDSGVVVLRHRFSPSPVSSKLGTG